VKDIALAISFSLNKLGQPSKLCLISDTSNPEGFSTNFASLMPTKFHVATIPDIMARFDKDTWGIIMDAKAIFCNLPNNPFYVSFLAIEFEGFYYWKLHAPFGFLGVECHLSSNKRELMNKKDLAVHLRSMTTCTREEKEGIVGDEPNKRYHFTKYLPLWTREGVTISPLGATCHKLCFNMEAEKG
jgi:hypothetical protein